MSNLEPGPYVLPSQALRELGEPAERVDDIAGNILRLCGFISFTGAGELIASVDFPVTFSERPSFSFGAELGENSPIQNGRLPTISGIVKDWRYKTLNKQAGARQYTGCTFLIVVTGLPDQQVIFHFQLEAPGKRNQVVSAPAGETHLLLGSPVTPPDPNYHSGDGIGIDYIGDADVVPGTVEIVMDGVAATLTEGGNLDFWNPSTSTLAPPYHGSPLQIFYFPSSMSLGSHVFTITVHDVDGNTDSKTWMIFVT